MKITFQTKEESNKKREAEFLSLSGAERISRFLELSERIVELFPTKIKKIKTENFVIDLSDS